MDDYGVEVFKPKDNKSAESKKVADKTPEDVNKVTDKLAAVQIAEESKQGPNDAVYKTENKKKKMVPEPEQLDEDEMYSQEPSFVISNSQSDIAQNFSMIQRSGERYYPKDTMYVFMGQEFLYLDYAKDTWAMGDVEYVQGSATFTLPQNASIVQVTEKEHNCKHSHAFLTGGVDSNGILLNWVFGIEFFDQADSQVANQQNNQLFMSFTDPVMALPIPRMMHESCLVQKKNGEWKLLVLGGKVGMDQKGSGYTDSVMCYDMKFIMDPYLRQKFDPENKLVTKWESVKNMENQRANFAHIVLDKLVYVFGGIISKGEKKNAHVPQIVNILTERYDINTDIWETIEIQNAPPLAAFAWTSLAPKYEGQIMLLGGTDGDLLSEQVWLIDFKNLVATEQEQTIGIQTAMGKLVYRPSKDMVYSFGGYGSGGQNYQQKVGQGQDWDEFERSHTALLSSSITGQNQEIELVHYTSVYFP